MNKDFCDFFHFLIRLTYRIVFFLTNSEREPFTIKIIYEFAGTAPPPDIRRDVAAKKERRKQSYDERHPLYCYTGIVSG